MQKLTVSREECKAFIKLYMQEDIQKSKKIRKYISNIFNGLRKSIKEKKATGVKLS
uniref:Uncharacterized protein n=1 Tax=viral metagenome TaxID=1070528 RepID=A0A6M3J483_9ZZZZ